MADKWTIGSNNEELYNGVKPPEERGTREKERIRRKSYCSIWKDNLKKNILSKSLPLGHCLK